MPNFTASNSQERSEPGSYGSEFVLFLNLNVFGKRMNLYLCTNGDGIGLSCCQNSDSKFCLLLTIKDSGVMPTEERL